MKRTTVVTETFDLAGNVTERVTTVTEEDGQGQWLAPSPWVPSWQPVTWTAFAGNTCSASADYDLDAACSA